MESCQKESGAALLEQMMLMSTIASASAYISASRRGGISRISLLVAPGYEYTSVEADRNRVS